MLNPTPELPDDTLISDVEFPTRIRNALVGRWPQDSWRSA
jgi:hypothetical protein